MNTVELLSRKRDGDELTAEEISRLIAEYADGTIPDYQMAALAMAVFLNGMTSAETAALTDAMRNSGEILQWDEGPLLVDKHSTGGVGDKVSLVLAPLLAAIGFRVPMISGRGLGPTGGTLDKLESIPGFRTDLSTAEFQSLVNRLGCAITGTTENIAPADKKLYALRDVTATVPSIPLITASIMSKKLAEGLDALVLDVKVGSGAFMKSRDGALRLAHSLVRTGARMGVRTRAILSDMNQPLGRFIGNAVEVRESIRALQGEGPSDVMEVTLALGAELLQDCGMDSTKEAAHARLRAGIDSGKAYERFEEMVRAQGGELPKLPAIGTARDVRADSEGFVAGVDTEKLGWAVIELGGGRKRLEDAIDHAVGLEMLVEIGDQISAGDPWIRVLGGSNSAHLEKAVGMISQSLRITTEPAERPRLIVDILVEETHGPFTTSS